jgi:hypothetical protein
VHTTVLTKPDDVVDRSREWELLAEFLTDPDPAMRLGIVSGRRRHGKSYLLQALSERVGGLYVTAVREEGRLPAIQRRGRRPRQSEVRESASDRLARRPLQRP